MLPSQRTSAILPTYNSQHDTLGTHLLSKAVHQLSLNVLGPL